MWKKMHGFHAPKNINVKIWRYMDFTKLISLFERKALFFARVDTLECPFEGSISLSNALNIKIKQDEDISKLLEPAKTIDELKDHVQCDDDLQVLREIRKDFFVNCWHINEYESAAMWSLYLKSNKGISIQSTYKRLRESFHNSKQDDVFIGKVRYVDYVNDFIRPYLGHGYYLCRPKSYEHEQELRALICRIKQAEFLGGPPRKEKGFYVNVNLNKLIEKIYIAPKSPIWFSDLVKQILKRYGIRKKIETSALAQRPIF